MTRCTHWARLATAAGMVWAMGCQADDDDDTDAGSDAGPPACDTPTPEACAPGGCPEGMTCDLTACGPSSCTCTDDGWTCTADCGGGTCVATTPGQDLWYLTCGDPACSGHTPSAGVLPCDETQVVATPCAAPGRTCDPGDACNARLVCADADPRQQPGGCPISKRAYKRDVAYLSPNDLDARYQALLALRLAEYHYREDPAGADLHLGFVLDDGAPPGIVRPVKDQIDLYGYTSLAVAAIQSQSTQIEALRAELAALRAEIAAGRDERRPK